MMMLSFPYDQPISAGTAHKVLKTCDLNLQTSLSFFRVLDFGCGNGRYMELFAKYIPQNNVFGTETNPEGVAQVTKKGFTCIQLQIEKSFLPFGDASFDLVFSSNVIEHIPRKLYLEYLLEIYRVLKPGKRFVVGTPNYPIKRLYDMSKAIKTGFTRYYLFDDPTHCNKMSIYRLEKDLKRLFKEVYLEPTYIFFQEKIPWLRQREVRHLLRVFGDKVFGYCIK